MATVGVKGLIEYGDDDDDFTVDRHRLAPTGVRVRAGKPSRYVASQLGRLSLLPSAGW